MIRVIGTGVAAALLSAAVLTPDLAIAGTAPPIHHAADIRLDPESRQLSITDIITVTGRKEVRFRLAPWLKATRLLLDRQAIPIPAAGAWRTDLPDTGRHRIELHLQGTMPALSARRGTGVEQAAALGPDGGYLFEGAGWLPATGDDRVGYRLRVEVPAAWRAVATGRLGKEDVGGTAYRAAFTADYPAAPPALFVGPYVVRERQSDGIRLRTYFYRDLAGLADTYLSDSARYLARYGTSIGAYPYSDFHVISAPVPVGLGFPNLTYIGRRILPLPFIRARSLAHEVLHNWWGNGVTVDYRTGNWAEGLTTYMADYALAAEKDAAEGRRMRLGWLRDYAALPADRDTPVTRFTAKHDEAAQVVGYNKVAFIFHMLRGEIGDAAFTASLRLFWQQHKDRAAGWVDLRRAFEAASGRDLGWFFDQWLNRAGAPRLSLAHGGIAAKTGGGGYRLNFTVRQDPPAWRLSVPVVVETASGPRHERIVLDGPETATSFELDTQPLALQIDPEHDIFRRLLPGEAPPILRDVTLASDVATVIAAKNRAMNGVARQLAERLLDTRMRLQPAGSTTPPAAPLLIIGATREVEAFLREHGLAGMPATVAGRGTARVWTAYGRGNRPLLAVAADTIDALQALLRPLPHYRSRSYLVFDGRQAIDKGIWPATRSPLTRRFN